MGTIIHSYQNVLYGTVGVDHSIIHGSINIEDAFPMVYSMSNYFICTFGESTIAVFRPESSSHWIIFDSHSRNSQGLSSPFGSAPFIQFNSYDNFLQFISENCLGL